jgi:cell division protein ZipA
MNDRLVLSLIILAVGFLVVLPLVYWLGSRRSASRGPTPMRRGGIGHRVEPMIGDDAGDGSAELDADIRAQLDELGQLLSDRGQDPEQGELLEPGAAGRSDETPAAVAAAGATDGPRPGVRPNRSLDRIVTLFVHARAGATLRGDDLVVVAEKVGLVYGDMGIYHRLLDGKEVEGPIFSMANIAKPGNFDLRRLSELETPGLSFFMTLPGPLPALDAWNSLLPVAQRVAQLLDAELLDESRNPLVEQTVAFLRNEMRQYDREQERQQVRANW